MIGAAALRAYIANCPSRPLRVTSFRALPLRYHANPLGRGRPIRRQRFNNANGARVLYVGDDQITCLHEVQAFGFPVSSLAIVPIELQLNAVLDLRDAAVQGALGITRADITMNFRPVPHPTDMQVLGEELAASGIVDGLLYESVAVAGRTCVALFETNVGPLGSVVRVNDPANNLNDQL